MTGIINSNIGSLSVIAGGWNPADDSPSAGSVLAYSSGNRIATHVGGAGTGASVRGLIGRTGPGRFYAEFEILVAHTDSNGINVGVADLSATLLDNWSSMGANEIIVANGNGNISNPSSSAFGSGITFNTGSVIVRMIFEPGVGIEFANGGGAFTTQLPFTASGNWAPVLNLGYHYTGGQYGQDGSVQIATLTGDFFYSVPGGTVEWG